jgi:hypothetical protein
VEGLVLEELLDAGGGELEGVVWACAAAARSKVIPIRSALLLRSFTTLSYL